MGDRVVLVVSAGHALDPPLHESHVAAAAKEGRELPYEVVFRWVRRLSCAAVCLSVCHHHHHPQLAGWLAGWLAACRRGLVVVSSGSVARSLTHSLARSLAGRLWKW